MISLETQLEKIETEISSIQFMLFTIKGVTASSDQISGAPLIIIVMTMMKITMIMMMMTTATNQYSGICNRTVFLHSKMCFLWSMSPNFHQEAYFCSDFEQMHESFPSSVKTEAIWQFDAGGIWEVSQESSSSFLLVKLQAVALNSEAASSVSDQLAAALDAGAGAELAGGGTVFRPLTWSAFTGSISLSGEEYVTKVKAFIESLKLDMTGSLALRLSYSITSVSTTLTEEQVSFIHSN